MPATIHDDIARVASLSFPHLVDAGISPTAVLAWYTGKALTDAIEALRRLEASAAAGEWIPNASRFIDARLKRSKRLEMIAVKAERTALGNVLWRANMDAEHGEFRRLVGHQKTGVFRNADLPAGVQRFIEDLTPVVDLLDRLDNTRPQPVFTSIGVSPTLTATLAALGVKDTISGLTNIRVCPIKWTTIERDGRHFKIGRLLWPEGTIHGASQHGRKDDARRLHCEACGHAIKNPFNWVPLLIDNSVGVPHSLWVGRDCAASLFGVKMTGDLEIAEG